MDPFRNEDIKHETLLCRQDVWYIETATSFSIPKHVGKWASLHIQRSNSELEAVPHNMCYKWAYQSLGWCGDIFLDKFGYILIKTFKKFNKIIKKLMKIARKKT